MYKAVRLYNYTQLFNCSSLIGKTRGNEPGWKTKISLILALK
jgi:hypothetical protein